MENREAVLNSAIDYSVRRRLLDRDLESASPALRGRILEVGSGRAGRRGQFQPPQQHVRWMHLDRDLSRRPHICGDVCQLPYGPAIFDAAVCLEVLEYVRRPEQALAELARVVKPGGVLLLSTPFVHRVDAPNDYWRFSAPALRTLLQDTGFEVTQAYSQGFALAAATNILRYAISVQGSMFRRIVAWLLFIPFEAALALDGVMARRREALTTITTGYLFVARRSGADA